MQMLPPFPDTTPTLENQDEQDLHLGDVWNTIRRHWWLVLAVLALCTGLAVTYAYRATPIFESTSLIRIDEKQSNLPALDILKSLAGGNQVNTEMQVLHSRTLADEVADSLGLQVALLEPRRTPRDEVLTFVQASDSVHPRQYTLTSHGNGQFAVRDDSAQRDIGIATEGDRFALGGATVELARGARKWPRIRIAVSGREDVLASMDNSLKITRPDREANIVVMTYYSSDQHLVRDVPNLLARRFISRRQIVQQTEARSTVKFLKEQIDTLSTQLASSEDQLRSFREGAQVVSLKEQATAEVGRMAEMQGERSSLDAERGALVKLLNQVNAEAAAQKPGQTSPYRRLIAFPTLLRNQAASALLASLASVEDQRSALLIRRTPQDPDVLVLTQRIHDIEEQLRGIATTYAEGLTNQVAAIDSTIGKFGKELEKVPATEIEFARLERRPKILVDIYTMLQTRLKEAEVAQAVEDPSVRIVDAAQMPLKPVSPKTTLLVILGVIGGLAAGIGLAFMREYMDRTVHTREQVQLLTGVAVLGLIPQIEQPSKRRYLPYSTRRRKPAEGDVNPVLPSPAKSNGKALQIAHGTVSPVAKSFSERLVAGADPRSPVTEAYRSLRTNITFANPDRPPRLLVFTSPVPAEGKTTSSANLAITLAQQGLRVLLVDADMRRGLLNQIFDKPREPGLSNVLLGSLTVTEAAHAVELGEGITLNFLATGTLPPNPAELLGSERMKKLLEQLRIDYDMVIFDTPPTNVVTDAAVLGSAVDGVVVVARAAVTRSEGLAYAMDLLRHVRAPVLGVVLNDIDFKRDLRYSSSYGSYGYYYYYAADARAN